MVFDDTSHGFIQVQVLVMNDKSASVRHGSHPDLVTTLKLQEVKHTGHRLVDVSVLGFPPRKLQVAWHDEHHKVEISNPSTECFE